MGGKWKIDNMLDRASCYGGVADGRLAMSGLDDRTGEF